MPLVITKLSVLMAIENFSVKKEMNMDATFPALDKIWAFFF